MVRSCDVTVRVEDETGLYLKDGLHADSRCSQVSAAVDNGTDEMHVVRHVRSLCTTHRDPDQITALRCVSM